MACRWFSLVGMPDAATALREHLSQACRNLPAALSENERNYEAMRTIVARIKAGETGLYDPENSGDSLAIVLAQLE